MIGISLYARRMAIIVSIPSTSGMPDQEGFETIMEIKRKYPHIKVVAISGGLRQGNLDILPMATALGADAAIEKPFKPEQLLDELERLRASVAA